MEHDFLKWDERSVPTIIEKTKEHFAKMYPDISPEGKHILWLRFCLYWEYYCKSVDCMVKIFFKDGSTPMTLDTSKLCVRQPYPNKRWHVACMKNGRKRSDAGVILPFDSFEELSKISCIKAYWTINDMFHTGEDNPYYICVNYDLAFTEETGAQNYCICSRETPLISLVDRTNEDDTYDPNIKLEEYDNVYTIESKTEDPDALFETCDIKGTVDDEHCYSSYLHCPDVFGPFLRIECFSAAEEIKGLDILPYQFV